jgi:hypothetical protein
MPGGAKAPPGFFLPGLSLQVMLSLEPRRMWVFHANYA